MRDNRSQEILSRIEVYTTEPMCKIVYYPKLLLPWRAPLSLYGSVFACHKRHFYGTDRIFGYYLLAISRCFEYLAGVV